MKIRHPKYCKYCGELLDTDFTCPRCGHKNLILDRKFLFKAYAIVITLIAIIFAIAFVTLKEKSSNNILSLESSLSDAQQLNDELSKKIRWYHNNVAIHTPNGECYHKADCHYIQDSFTQITSLDHARSLGYRPCSTCYSDE